jgi:hypothetical protein
MNKFLRSLALRVLLVLLMAVSSSFAQNPDRVTLFPKLDIGQSLRYQIGYRSKTNTATISSVIAPMAPTGGQTDAQILLQVEVADLPLDGGKPAVHLRTRIISQDAAAPVSSDPQKSAAPEKEVEFVLHHDGQVTDLSGLDKLSVDEKTVWREWVARFGGGAALPEKGVKLGDKWKSEEPITTAQLSGLFWEKESVYVNDSPCAARMASPQSDTVADDQPQETCAVILTTATIKQKSNPKDATPEDYKLHDLRNMGIAKGANEIITYISLKTGLVVRATEDASQSLNVIVAKTDGSNRVHYIIDAESHAQTVLLAEPPSSHP